jgi:hypothetical protein
VNVPDRGNAHDDLSFTAGEKLSPLGNYEDRLNYAQEFFRSSSTCLRTRLRKHPAAIICGNFAIIRSLYELIFWFSILPH